MLSLKHNLNQEKQSSAQTFDRKTFKFLTMKNLLQESRRNKQFVKKTQSTNRKQLILGNRHKNKKQQPLTNSTVQNIPQLQVNNLYQKCVQKNQVNDLDYQVQKYYGMWQKFLFSTQNIKKKNIISDKFFPSQQDRQAYILSEIMKSMEYLIEEQDNKIDQVQQKIYSTQEKIQNLYVQSHQMHEKQIINKKKTLQHQLEYGRFLQRLNEQKKQRQHSRLISQQIHQLRPIKLKSQNQPLKSKETSPIKFMNDLNLTQKQISKIIQKKKKLNLELDLKFQLQLRKRIQVQKSSFEEMKNNLSKQKIIIANRIKQISQKIQFKQKQIQRYENQKDKLRQQIKIFLKMLLKNPNYRSDGVLWIFKKMINFGFQPQVLDFPDNLDFDSKTFLVNQFNLMKKQNTFTKKPQKPRIKIFKKPKTKNENRTRVKSLAFFKNGQDQIQNVNLNINSPPKQEKNFFSFGHKKFENNQNFQGIRKKSDSLTFIKSFESFLQQNLEFNTKNDPKDESLTKTLMNVTNRKKIYDSTKKYLKTWVSNQGWNSFTSRGITKVQEPIIPEKFIKEQKQRAKSTYFKVGRTNTKYKQVVKTLFGSDQSVNKTAKRIKTSRE